MRRNPVVLDLNPGYDQRHPPGAAPLSAGDCEPARGNRRNFQQRGHGDRGKVSGFRFLREASRDLKED
jgi:hypothetical protein